MKKQKYTNEQIDEIFFDWMYCDRTIEEFKEETGVKKVEIEEDILATIYYPDGEITTHWL